MQRLARLGLRLLGLVVPVVIAACYGAPAAYQASKCGTVVDIDTKQGIIGIEVLCRDAAGVELDMAYADSNGAFCVVYAEGQACATLEARDVDGAENGIYESATVPVAEDVAPTIELTKITP